MARSTFYYSIVVEILESKYEKIIFAFLSIIVTIIIFQEKYSCPPTGYLDLANHTTTGWAKDDDFTGLWNSYLCRRTASESNDIDGYRADAGNHASNGTFGLELKKCAIRYSGQPNGENPELSFTITISQQLAFSYPADAL
jgi:hypothetical protein